MAIDLVLGTWGTDDLSDHETYSCLMRSAGTMAVDPIAEQVHPTRRRGRRG